ncbi:MAG: hypothetical protein ACFFCW_28640, partial [Candidatus Hodarchaeota archaeon]
KNASHYLRADRFMARNILVPQFRVFLEDTMGNATPLAHGFDLALQTLRHNLQHGRNAIMEARLVVLSDGRGNVPLGASLTRNIKIPVSLEGINDTIEMARQIGRLNCVEAIFLNPQPKECPDLPKELAYALGATLIDIPSKKSSSKISGTPSEDSDEDLY